MKMAGVDARGLSSLISSHSLSSATATAGQAVLRRSKCTIRRATARKLRPALGSGNERIWQQTANDAIPVCPFPLNQNAAKSVGGILYTTIYIYFARGFPLLRHIPQRIKHRQVAPIRIHNPPLRLLSAIRHHAEIQIPQDRRAYPTPTLHHPIGLDRPFSLLLV